MADDAENKEFIAGRVKALEEAVRFFSPQAKEEREKWIAEHFLSFVRPGTPDSEIRWVDAEPWDVLCLGAKFQIKEIQEPGRRRHMDYKEALVKARNVADPNELLEPYTPTTIRAADAQARVVAQLRAWTDKYAPDVAICLDLLVYLNIESSVSTDNLVISDTADLARWRSVSVVCNDCAFVMVAAAGAPNYLREGVGVVRRRPSY